MAVIRRGRWRLRQQAQRIAEVELSIGGDGGHRAGSQGGRQRVEREKTIEEDAKQQHRVEGWRRCWLHFQAGWWIKLEAEADGLGCSRVTKAALAATAVGRG